MRLMFLNGSIKLKESILRKPAIIDGMRSVEIMVRGFYPVMTQRFTRPIGNKNVFKQNQISSNKPKTN